MEKIDDYNYIKKIIKKWLIIKFILLLEFIELFIIQFIKRKFIIKKYEKMSLCKS